MVVVKRSRQVKRVVQSVAGILTGRLAGRMSIPTTLDYKMPADVPVLPTGLRPLDRALGLGGLPYGRITELIGQTTVSLSGGTTSIAARIASRAQRKQQIVSIIDMSRSFDPWLAERAGLIAPQLLLTRPDTVFAALSTMESAASREGLIVVAMGIINELLAQADIEALKTLSSRVRRIVKQSSSVFLFISLLHTNDPFDPAHYPAGFPLANLADIRLWVQDEAWTHKEGVAASYKANVTVIKNELAVAGVGADIKIRFSS